MDHKMSKEDAFKQWVRENNNRHQQALVNLQDWFFALARCCEVKPENLAKAIMQFPEQGGFGQNLQMRLREETQAAMKAEKEKLKPVEKPALVNEFAPPVEETK